MTRGSCLSGTASRPAMWRGRRRAQRLHRAHEQRVGDRPRCLRDRLSATGELSGAAALYSSMLPRASSRPHGSSLRECGDPDIGSSPCYLCELHPGEADGLTWASFRELYGEPRLGGRPYSAICLREVRAGSGSWKRAAGAVASLRTPRGRVRRGCVSRRSDRGDDAEFLADEGQNPSFGVCRRRTPR